MAGARFGAVCAILVTSLVVATPASSVTQTNRHTAAKPTDRVAAKPTDRVATNDRSRKVVRRRHVARHVRSRQQVRQAAPESTRPASHPEPSTAARRFREFVRPRSLAVNPVEELRRPSIDAAQFSSRTAYPLADSAALEPFVQVADPGRAAAAAAGETGFAANTEAAQPEPSTSQSSSVTVPSVVGPAASTPAATAASATTPPANTASASVRSASTPTAPSETTSPPNAASANVESTNIPPASAVPEPAPARVAEARAADRDGSKSNWVRIIFVTWGGLLTLGSALRMLVG